MQYLLILCIVNTAFSLVNFSWSDPKLKMVPLQTKNVEDIIFYWKITDPLLTTSYVPPKAVQILQV